MRFGALGEEAAADLLRSGGYRIVARNHRCPRGEIDLIAAKGELLVFVEVRTRATGVIAAARDYLAQRRGPAKAARFDVIAVVDSPQGPALTHFENAFDAGP